MKRLFAFMTVVLLLLNFFGCGTNGAVDYDAMSDEDAMVRKAADAALTEKYQFDCFSHCEIKIDKYPAKESYTVTYKVNLFGYDTYERYSVIVGYDGAVQEVGDSFYAGKFSSFLPNLTETKMKNAEKKLKEKTKNYTSNFIYHLSVNEDEDLVLNCETIISYTNEHGNEDHNHVMFSEVVCKKVD